MISKWYHLKDEALKLRRRGHSLRNIELKLKIPRSTLSSWLKNVPLSKNQKALLHKKWGNALIKARKKAVLWHNAQKQARIKIAEKEADNVLKNLNIKNKNISELALSLLYLGEGSKNNPETAIGSSDPMILKFFLTVVKNVYNLDVEKIRCELYIRADQNPREIIKFWSEKLSLPTSCFKQVNFDKRTAGSKTFDYYKGVCSLRCGNVAIQRRLLFLGRKFCQKIIGKSD